MDGKRGISLQELTYWKENLKSEGGSFGEQERKGIDQKQTGKKK